MQDKMLNKETGKMIQDKMLNLLIITSSEKIALVDKCHTFNGTPFQMQEKLHRTIKGIT